MSAPFNTQHSGNATEVEDFLAKHSYLSGKTLPGKEDAEALKLVKDAPDHLKTPFTFAWWWTLNTFDCSVKALWGADHTGASKKPEAKKEEAKKEEAKKEEEIDEDDFFGDDDTGAEEAKKQLQAKLNEKKAEKKVVIAKSRVVFEVKGYEAEQDFNELGNRIMKEINRDGLVWQDTFKVVPHVYGIFKLQMTMIIEDDKVSADDILEQISSTWEDEVQSCDILEFNKA